MKKKSTMLYLGLSLLPVFALSQALVQEVVPSSDVIVRTAGGGDGLNTFLKFDISAIPSGKRIDSVILRAYVWNITGNWDGNVKFWNVNSQTWQETDSNAAIWRIPTSDTLLQNSGFGTAVGWARSCDVKAIFLADYNASRTYCTFKMKDPDDRTFMPVPGLANNTNETLGLGNRAFNFYAYFYPREYNVDTTRRSRLAVYYSLTDIKSDHPGKFLSPQLKVCPNPFDDQTQIRYIILNRGTYTLNIYGACGQLIKTLVERIHNPGLYRASWNGRDIKGVPVAAGVYFVQLEQNCLILVHKIVKIE